MPSVKRNGRRTRPVDELKAEVIHKISLGETVAHAMMSVDRTVKTYEAWRAKDPDFRAAIDRLRQGVAEDVKAKRSEGFPDFADFSAEYLDAPVFPHMQNVVDLMEGRDPSWLHPAMNWERAS